MNLILHQKYLAIIKLEIFYKFKLSKVPTDFRYQELYIGKKLKILPEI